MGQVNATLRNEARHFFGPLMIGVATMYILKGTPYVGALSWLTATAYEVWGRWLDQVQARRVATIRGVRARHARDTASHVNLERRVSVVGLIIDRLKHKTDAESIFSWSELFFLATARLARICLSGYAAWSLRGVTEIFAQPSYVMMPWLIAVEPAINLLQHLFTGTEFSWAGLLLRLTGGAAAWLLGDVGHLTTAIIILVGVNFLMWSSSWFSFLPPWGRRILRQALYFFARWFALNSPLYHLCMVLLDEIRNESVEDAPDLGEGISLQVTEGQDNETTTTVVPRLDVVPTTMATRLALTTPDFHELLALMTDPRVVAAYAFVRDSEGDGHRSQLILPRTSHKKIGLDVTPIFPVL